MELLVALALLGLLIAVAVWLFGYAARTLTHLMPRFSLQQNSRKAMVRFLREVQEGMEVVSPTPGATLSYAVIADKVANLKWFYQLPETGGPVPTSRLLVFTRDAGSPGGQQPELLLTGIRRLTFTCLSEGALQVNLTLLEEGVEASMLTTVRLRNLPSAEELW